MIYNIIEVIPITFIIILISKYFCDKIHRKFNIFQPKKKKINWCFLLFIIYYYFILKDKNGKWSITMCRHHILYPLWLGAPFPNDCKILKPKVGFGLDQIMNWLEEGFYKKYNSFINKIKLFLKNKGHGNPKATYINTHMHMQVWCMHMHTWTCVHS